MMEFLSTPSVRRATRVHDGNHCRPDISIHALREEGDQPLPFATQDAAKISIHALREEGDRAAASCCGFCSDFYPRPP